MRNGRVFERYTEHAVFCVIISLANGVRDFACLTETKANTTFFVPNNHQRAEAETTTTLHHFGRTIDENHLLAQVALILLKLIAIAWTPRTAPAWTAAAATATATPAETAALSSITTATATTLLTLRLSLRCCLRAGGCAFYIRRGCVLSAGLLGILVICHNKVLLLKL
jgi:hypothetical protein